MIAHEIAMVGGKDHHRVVGKTVICQRFQYVADGIVDHGDGAVIQRNGVARLFLGAGKGPLAVFLGAAFVVLPIHFGQMRR